jgi:hypothetical protein
LKAVFLAGLLTLAALPLIAPAADAAPYACTDAVTPSCGGLVCVGSTTSVPTCVRDPCRIAHCVTLVRLYCIEGQNCPSGELACALPDTAQICVTDPCYTTACFPAAHPWTGSAQCTVLVGSGAAGGVCEVNGKPIGPIQTCDTCAVLFYEVCTAGTEGVECWSG